MNRHRVKCGEVCLSPVWRDKGRLEIRPKAHSGQLIAVRDSQGHESVWCKCCALLIKIRAKDSERRSKLEPALLLDSVARAAEALAALLADTRAEP